MKVFIEKDNITKEIEITQPTKIEKVVKDLGIQIESVVLVKNDEICLEDELVSNEDSLKLLSVVSGG